MALPTCRFDPQQMRVWSNRTGVHLFSDAQRDEAYLRARPFFLEQMRALLKRGWERTDRNDLDEILFDINHKPRKAPRGHQSQPRDHLILPDTFNHFLDASKAEAWRAIFENAAIFRAAKQDGNNHDVYISASPPLSNIFYLLQILAPGMLVIYNEYQLPDADVNIVKASRVLPRPNWIQRNHTEVMGNKRALLAAAKNQKILFHEERTTRTPSLYTEKSPLESSHGSSSSTVQDVPKSVKRYNSRRYSKYTVIQGDYFSDPSEGYDWTVCDKDCGWCGRCQWGD